VVFLRQGSGVIGALVSIVLAFVLRNVWALVIGLVSEAIFRCLMSYIMCPFRPRFDIHKESFRDLFRFARGAFGLTILAYIAYHTDILVLSKVVSTDKVGLYAWALALAAMPQQFYQRIITPIMLPAFSEKQDDSHFIGKSMVKLAMVVSMLCLPFLAFVLTCSDSILSVLYGQKFAEVSLPFVLLYINTVIRLQWLALGGVCFALGKPYVNRRYSIVRAFILVGLIYPAVLFIGLPGAALVVLLSSFIAFAMQAHWVCREIGLKFRDYILAWIYRVRLSIWVLAIGLILRFLAGTSDIANLLVVGSACLIVCLLNLFKFRSSRKISQAKDQVPLVIGQT
jgi:O-antigen/teichoic acid export membrane protein